MAKYNEILSGRHNRFLQKLFSMKGPPPAPQLSGDIQVSQAIFHGAENRFIEQWNRFGMAAASGPTAASVTQFRWRNPSNSGVIAVLERLSFSEGANDDILVTQDTNVAALPAALGQRCLDNRPVRGGTSTLGPATQWTTNTGAVTATGGIIGRPKILANQEFTFIVTENQEITLLPGDALEVSSVAVNVVLNCSVLWRERVLEDSELF